ncbi:Spo0E family sporulation regulatory protein-aspartic acid phosphatase [Paenibacillus melissococcoides]|uniref:Spo0E family sporulation regulatory protein-aspartic acid phosphatase n=1 Tax=Paenibacillus melissococcoides TaxID=2912268 RepID=A0ABM9G7I0_9BACL|nr:MULTISPECIES: Spo0E family sporulation regulatory protein-aspartic acid phosphatase [Paenibacillus]MEB9896099.1 Spo0E family sporulation regulatory protein-aspartic acid phosphatase [Bacillus cereus]CAH8247182.1 Spo0E family sporulation regulatory protein-aspartic acid phosphatase [Paenibacillus melissococcoides]CAH8716975.1 Spo0E family sporulation regulatory protein-aspartic acid phosphatase [Paenibacillus melissococcoides]CAH8717938.1 Spo0E family sporulation regulatory protein-aspartic a
MAQVLSIGELIQRYRHNRDMTLSQLAEVTGLHKGTISKIENGDVKRPEYMTIRPLVDTLQIPLETLVELHITVEKRADTLLFVLQDVIQHSGTAELVTKVGRKVLEPPLDDSHALVERLYDFVGHVENKEIKLALYQVIVDYSRDHGIMPFLARGLFQVYLIERDDFTRMRDTYDSYKHIVMYADFLSAEDRIMFYYKLGIHAYNLFLYPKSIELALHVIQEAKPDNEYYAHALGILRSAYFRIGDYEKSEYYNHLYSKYDAPYIKENVMLTNALLNAKRGKTDVAVSQLNSLLETCDQGLALSVLNQLMDIYLQECRLFEAEKTLSYPIDPQQISHNNPNLISQLAEYYYHRAEYFITVCDIQKGVSDLQKSAWYFSKVNDIDNEKEGITKIDNLHATLLAKVKELKQKLIHIANQKGKLTDDEVVQISQQLDIYILELQKYEVRVNSRHRLSYNSTR